MFPQRDHDPVANLMTKILLITVNQILVTPTRSGNGSDLLCNMVWIVQLQFSQVIYDSKMPHFFTSTHSTWMLKQEVTIEKHLPLEKLTEIHHVHASLGVDLPVHRQHDLQLRSFSCCWRSQNPWDFSRREPKIHH
jgi:hypothetical protein